MIAMEMELYALPHHGRERATITKLKKHNQGTHHYISVREGWVCLYVANKTMTARCEWWLDGLLAQEVIEKTDSFVLIEQRQDNQYCDKDNYQGYFWDCFEVSQGVVKQVWRKRKPIWNSLALSNAERVLVVGEAPGLELDTCEYIAAHSGIETLAEYQLTMPKNHMKLGLSVLGVMVAVGVGVLGWQSLSGTASTGNSNKVLTQSKPSLEHLVLPTWGQYRVALNQSYGAKDTLAPATSLAAYLSLAPKGWRIGEIVQEDGVLVTQLHRESDGLLSVMQAWLEKHSVLNAYVAHSLDKNAIELRVPTNQGIEAWLDKLLPLNPSWLSLQDALTLIGMKTERLISGTEEQTQWQRYRWAVSKDSASLADIQHLDALLTELPIGIESLILTPSGQGYWKVSFTMNLFGGL